MQLLMFLDTRPTTMARIAAAVALASAFVVGGRKAQAGPIQASWTDFSVVTIGGTTGTPAAQAGNLSTQADITGNAFVAGTVTGLGTAAQDLPNVVNPLTSPQYALTVAGDLDFGNSANINDGYSAEYAGSHTSGNLNLNGGGILTHDTSGDLGQEKTSLSNQIHQASTAFSSMGNTGSVTGASTLTFNYTGSANGAAVFSVSASQLQNATELDLFRNGASSVVINVTGATSNFILPSDLHSEGDFDAADASKILWNFGSLTGTLETQTEFFGSFLAPDANFQNTTDFNGSIFVESYSGGGEIHYSDNGHMVRYNGIDPVAVPEPSSILLTESWCGQCRIRRGEKVRCSERGQPLSSPRYACDRITHQPNIRVGRDKEARPQLSAAE